MLGDQNAGCSIEPQGASILLKGWGFWSKETALGFSDFVLRGCGANPAADTLKVDFGRLNPLRDEGQAAFTTLLRQLSGTAIRKVQIDVGSHMTKLQLLRLVKENHAEALVEIHSGTT